MEFLALFHSRPSALANLMVGVKFHFRYSRNSLSLVKQKSYKTVCYKIYFEMCIFCQKKSASPYTYEIVVCVSEGMAFLPSNSGFSPFFTFICPLDLPYGNDICSLVRYMVLRPEGTAYWLERLILIRQILEQVPANCCQFYSTSLFHQILMYITIDLSDTIPRL
jgi:hypothetical protein